MNTAEHLGALYKIIRKVAHPDEAREAVITAVSLVMREIQEEGLEVTPELIHQKIEVYVNDFIEVDKKNSAA